MIIVAFLIPRHIPHGMSVTSSTVMFMMPNAFDYFRSYFFLILWFWEQRTVMKNEKNVSHHDIPDDFVAGLQHNDSAVFDQLFTAILSSLKEGS